MKRLSTIIMALALVLGMSQCKKQETPTTTGNNTEGTVHITVKVDGKDGKDENGDKHAIAPEHGLFAFTDNDKIYVGHGGKYVGQLTFTNGFFEGDITPVTGAQDYLHFYFLGGMTPATAPTVGTTESFTISIADQSKNLPVLSYGASTTQFTDLNTTYSVTLKNKCALVKFMLEYPTDKTVTLENVPTVATVNFDHPTLENAIAATDLTDLHDITLRYDANWNNNLRWVILLPGTNLSNCGVTWQGEGNMPAMENNTYVNANLQLNNPAPVPDAPDAQYAVHTAGENPVLTQFSVSANKKVYFSRANLKYTAAAGYHFHDTQFDEIYPALDDGYPAQSAYNSNVHLSNTSDMDRFCWGYKVNATPGGQQYVEGNHDLDSDTDWGSQLTTEGSHWRTLTADEWNYLLYSRGPRSFMMVTAVIPYGTSYLRCRGLLLFPDGFNHSDIQGLYYSTDNSNPAKAGFNTAWYNKKDFTQTQIDGSWRFLYQGIDKLSDGNNYMFITNEDSNMYKLLAAGCVFLPALGYRYGTEITKYGCYDYANYPGQGFYWTATNIYSENHEYAKYLWFGIHGADNGTSTSNEEYVGTASSTGRNSGMCVRLVWDAN